MKIQLDDLIFIKENELKILQLLYFYRHLNDINLNIILVTNLIVYRVKLILSIKSFIARAQIR